MTGILCALVGISGGTTSIVTVGSYVLTVKSISIYYYGYDGATGGTPSTFGSISGDAFKGATIKAVYSVSPNNSPGNAISYVVVFSGNQSAGFFNSLTVDGTLVSGTLGSPSYNSGNDETSFTITLGASAATLFGTTVGATKTVVIS